MKIDKFQNGRNILHFLQFCIIYFSLIEYACPDITTNLLISFLLMMLSTASGLSRIE